jgi:hypothetical protein
VAGDPLRRILTVEHAHDHVLAPGGQTRLFDDTAVTIYSVE